MAALETAKGNECIKVNVLSYNCDKNFTSFMKIVEKCEKHIIAHVEYNHSHIFSACFAQ